MYLYTKSYDQIIPLSFFLCIRIYISKLNILELIENDINPVFIPSGYTDVCQSLDVAINKPVKDYLEKHYQKWLEQAKPSDYTKGDNRRKPPYELVFEWLALAVKEIKESTIIRSFEKTGLKKGIWSDWSHLSPELKSYFFKLS